MRDLDTKVFGHETQTQNLRMITSHKWPSRVRFVTLRRSLVNPSQMDNIGAFREMHALRRAGFVSYIFEIIIDPYFT